jgi:hypothetical protein
VGHRLARDVRGDPVVDRLRFYVKLVVHF